MQRVEPISKPTQKVVKLFRDFWLYCIIMGFSEAEMGMYRNVQFKSYIYMLSVCTCVHFGRK